MKSVVCAKPDQVELSLSDRRMDSFVLDSETYYYFRDQIFIEGILNYIKQRHPGELPVGKVIEGFPHGSPAAKVAHWFETQDVIVKYYEEWRRQESRFYTHDGRVYSFVFLGFLNVGNEIELLRWEPEEIAALLDEAYRYPIRWTLKMIFK